MPFGVELPDNLGQQTSAPDTTSEAPEGHAPETVSKAGQPEATDSPTKSELLDLDKLERFRFQGKEWSAKDLRNAYLMREDYTRKTQALSKEREAITEAAKYRDNFDTDLQSVIANPKLLDQMRSVYPKEYVAVAEKILGRLERPQLTPKETDPEFQQLKGELAEWRREREEQEVKNVETWLDTTYQKLSTKYPDANSELVTARAEAASKQGTQITEAVLDKLFKQSHAETLGLKSKWEKATKDKATKQIKTGAEGRDIGPGGGIPGSAPRGFKTIKEATSAFLQDIGKQ